MPPTGNSVLIMKVAKLAMALIGAVMLFGQLGVGL